MTLRRFTIALAALCLAGASAKAERFPVNAFIFGGGPFQFGGGPFDFGGGPVAFPSTLIEEDKCATVEVTLPADILFDFDKADIRASAADALHELADRMRQEARGPVTVKGYTDSLGKDAYNQKLSERRAAAIKAWLVAKEGLGQIKYMTMGFGPRDPVAPNKKPDGSDDPDGRQLNRRVTVVMTK